MAYEHAAAGLPGGGDCLSLVLAGTPADMRAAARERARLEAEVRRELALDDRATDPDAAARAVRDALSRRHECRLPRLPAALVAARAGRGTPAAFGPDDVADYVARPPRAGAPPLPPVLVARGRHDVVASCRGGWRDVFARAAGAQGGAGASYREEVLEGAAHYAHLEQPAQFGALVAAHCFVHDY